MVIPNFKTSGSQPLHGGEQNEYGPMAAYSSQEFPNRAHVPRADVD